MRTRVLIRSAAMLFALVTAAAGVAGWLALEMVAATVEVAPQIDEAAEPSEELLDIVDSTVTNVRDSLTVVADASGQLGESTDSVADIVESVADLTTGRIPATLSTLEASLPGLIDTAQVIDETLRTLSFVGVQYDPEVPFDEALAEVHSQLEGLPELITEDGEELRSLVPRIRQAGEDSRRLVENIEAIDADLAEAQEVIAEYDDTVAELRGLRTVATDVSTLVPIARVALVVLVVSGLATAVVGWVIAARVPEPAR